ncbi:hypothetical protein B0H14DRAFT_2643408 [Mycena olivaceomarginata]|nr:hypothetical protein B0H14DRAFT_2643408 [Mycena olivaceomarginata]
MNPYSLSYAKTYFDRKYFSIQAQIAWGCGITSARLTWRSSWKSTGDSELREDERLYRAAFIRYLNGRGIVEHKQLPRDNLTEHEKSILEDHPLARAMVFMKDFGPPPDGRTAPDPNNADPAHNPDHWSNHILPVRGHTCFDGVDLPLLGPSKLLKQPVPDDDDTSTDFDAYQYIMYRPATVFQEFGGIHSGLFHLQNALWHPVLANLMPMVEIGALYTNAYFRTFGSIEGLANIP